MEPGDAYRACEEITWSQARNFSYGIRLLPTPKRRALAAVYAFARRIDDIGDGDLPAEQKLTALRDVRASLTGLLGGGGEPGAGAADSGEGEQGANATGSGGSGAGGATRRGGDPVLVALADAAGRFPIPLEAFGELIDGCEADVRGAAYTTFDELLHYCRCVAGSVGRLSLGVFGAPDLAAAAPLADSLGVALQLTNILRDIREDHLDGRVYLPAEDLERFGASLEPGGAPGGAGLADLVRFEAERARGWYETGWRLLPLLDRRSAASAGAMAGIYFRLLRHIAARPEAVLSRRVSLPPAEKAMVAARCLAGMARRPRGRAAPRPATAKAAP